MHLVKKYNRDATIVWTLEYLGHWCTHICCEALTIERNHLILWGKPQTVATWERELYWYAPCTASPMSASIIFTIHIRKDQGLETGHGGCIWVCIIIMDNRSAGRTVQHSMDTDIECITYTLYQQSTYYDKVSKDHFSNIIIAATGYILFLIWIGWHCTCAWTYSWYNNTYYEPPLCAPGCVHAVNHILCTYMRENWISTHHRLSR